jgi:hypothetical protein
MVGLRGCDACPSNNGFTVSEFDPAGPVIPGSRRPGSEIPQALA